ncbi:MAG: filamentous hemagglutinin N-terminal domain-containing protein [Planctomycetota bacterium]|jgi:filamentous hemagglutinin family protein
MGNVRRISKKYYFRQIVACFLMSCLFFNTSVALAVNPPPAGALPQSGVVPGGYGSASYTYETNKLTIDNLAAQTVINWDSFDIGSLSSVYFDDAANFAVLNRVTGNTGTTGIYGDLFANGTIFVINTRGIVFGPDSYIQARNFVASGIDIRNDDFMNGVYQFEENFENPYSDRIGNVTNEGIGTDHGIYAEQVALIGRNVTNKGKIVAEGQDNYVVMAAGDRVFLGRDGSDVVVDVDLNFSPSHVVDNGGDVGSGPGTGPGTITAPGGKVILAAGDIYSTAISGVESLRAEATRNITLEGAVSANGDIALIADKDLQYGGDVTTNAAVTSANGNVDIAGNLIDLNENVSAEGGDLTITGRTSQGLIFDMEESFSRPEPERYWGYVDVAEGKKLYASDNVIVIDAFGSGGDEHPFGKMDLFGHGSLEIEAEGGEIITQDLWDEPDRVKITVKDTSPASLTLKQSEPLNLVDYTFGNQENTDLTLVSYNNSVTAVDGSHPLSGKDNNAADKWKSIGATAETDITLQGHDEDNPITATALTSSLKGHAGNISVTSVHNKVKATGEIIANNGSVTLTAVDPDKGGIELHANVTSGDFQDYIGDVELKNDVTAESTGGSDITFTRTIDGPHGLTVKTAGVTKFQGVIGGNERLTSLTTDEAGRTEIWANIYLNGPSATFKDPVLLMNNLTIDEAGTGNIEFANTVDSEEGSNYTLTVDTGDGATIFGGAVGGDALGDLSDDEGLGAVTTNAAGSTQINGGYVKTTGDQTYKDPVTLGAHTSLDATNVTFNQTLDSDSGNNRGLNVYAHGVTKFNGAVGATDPLYFIFTDWAGSTQINGGSVTTTGWQDYVDPVTLGADTTLNSQNVAFWNTLNSDSAGTPRNLLVNASGQTYFSSPVGGIAPLASLETDAPGWTEISGDFGWFSYYHLGSEVP